MNFKNYLRAGYPVLWCETFEEDRAIGELGKQAEGYKIWQWDIIGGLMDAEGKNRQEIEDPEGAFSAIKGLPDGTVLFVKDAHRYMEDLRVVRTVRNLLALLKSTDRHIVFVAPTLKIPLELQKDVCVIDFKLPEVDQLVELATTIAADNGLELVIDAKVIGAAKGLTISEAENALARSIIETKGYSREVLEEEKLQAVKKSGLAEIWPAESMTEVGGLEVLKRYISSRAPGFLEGSNLPQPRGILLAGLPGSGKSLCAKATASALEMPLIRLDLGTLKGSLVGESEANMRKATQLIDAISPCVVWLDEIEKSLSGVQSSGKTDGGTGANMFGQLLTWMQESKAKHYIVATCNDIDDLFAISQGALIRRFDDIFFVDLPSEEERREIYQIMLRRYNVNDPAFLALDAGMFREWTGAEIEKFVKNALYDGIGKAMENIRPIAQQNREKIEKAREWAKWNAISANGNGEAVKGNQIRQIRGN
jgi:SpoVK/Ycf46/Vps4 family AAA+-type ATPase